MNDPVTTYLSNVTAIQYQNISYIILGAYVPLTRDGNIVVDQMLASCYASFDHDLAHLMMMPMQWYPEMLGFIFGVNNEYRLCQHS